MPVMAAVVNAHQALVRMSELRRRRRIAGLCAEPGCPEVTGDTFRCTRHAAAYAKRVREYRKRLKQRRESERRLEGRPPVGRY